MISVVMPVYNGQKFLKQSIDSILNQTYENFELINFFKTVNGDKEIFFGQSNNISTNANKI